MVTDEEILDLRNVLNVVTPKYKRLIEIVIAEREELNKEIERQEMRYQTFVSEAVSNIKIRDNTIARQSAKIQALESKLTRLMNGTNGYA